MTPIPIAERRAACGHKVCLKLASCAFSGPRFRVTQDSYRWCPDPCMTNVHGGPAAYAEHLRVVHGSDRHLAEEDRLA